MRMALARQRVKYDGAHYTLPLPDGPGKALTLTVHPARERIPLYLASVGPKNLELTGEIADGWLSIFFAPSHAEPLFDHLLAGRKKAGHDDLDGFDVVATVPTVVGDDVSACAEPVRHYAALYVGGMGSREKNFYNRLATDMGYVDEAKAVQDLYLARDYAGAAAAVPEKFVDDTSLLGPVERIAERMAAFAEAGVTTLNVVPFAGTLEDRHAILTKALEALRASGHAS